MRRKSSINREKRQKLIENARHMTAEQRVEAAVNLTQNVQEIASAGKRYREDKIRKSHP